MLKNTLWLTIGIVIGVLSTTLLRNEVATRTYDATVADDAEAVVGSSQRASTTDVPVGSEAFSLPNAAAGGARRLDTEAEVTLSSGAQVPSSAAGRRDADTPVSDLPGEYASLLGQSDGPRRMTPAENEEFFSEDARDEQWAYTMEVGLKEYFASSLPGEGMAIEHLECRSRMCRIAGLVYPGYENNMDVHLDRMRHSGWWQLSESQRTVGAGNADGVYRFITYIPRNSDDALIADIAACTCDEEG